VKKKEISEVVKHVKAIQPNSGEIPSLKGYDIFGESIQLTEALGGDHIIYLDYKKRYSLDFLVKVTLGSDKSATEKQRIVANIEKSKTKIGILLADISGHDVTDVILSYGFHQAFLTGVSYEMMCNGEVTLDLIDVLNNRFLNSYSKFKYLTVIYGEFYESGDFRFVSAGHPLPLIYSYEVGAVCNLHKSSYSTSLPMSMFPSFERKVEQGQKNRQFFNRFSVNQSHIPKSGDIVMLYSDGLLEHADSQGKLFYDTSEKGKGGRIQEVMNKHKNSGAKDLFYAIKEDLLNFAKPTDDISYVIIRKE